MKLVFNERKIMINIILNGCGGKMGKFVSAKVKSDGESRVICGVDKFPSPEEFPVFSSAEEIPADLIKEAHCLIDFSTAAAFDSVIDFCQKNKIPAVIATTGLGEEQKAKMQIAGKEIPVFFTANMSIGVNLVTELAKTAAKILGSDFDIEIVEMHHNQKLDAPSGTALMIADEIKEVTGDSTYYEYDRHLKREKRSENEIGIHSLRGGTVTGEHKIIFAGNDEIVEISHSARSRNLFATGALNAAKYIYDKEPGIYSMKDLIEKGNSKN